MDKNIFPLGNTKLNSWVRENQRNISQSARQSTKTIIILVIGDNYQWDVRLSKICCSGSHVDWFLRKVSHLAKYSTFPFLFRCFRIFPALNTVLSSITIASGVDSFAFWSWFFAFSWSDSLFDSFSFWRCREWRLNTNWIRFRRNWLQTIFWNIRFINVPLGRVIGRRRVNWSQIRINKWLHTICVTRESNFFLLAIVRNLKWTGDNFSTILYGPNQLCINFLNNPFLVLGV